MEKIPLLLLTCLLGSFGARAQTSAAPAVLGTAGQTFTADNLVLDWTVGEVAVAAWQPVGGPAQILEGFHRGTWVPAELADAAVDARVVYPNPFKSEVWVKVAAETTAVQLEVYDLQGRRLRSLAATPEQGLMRLELADLPVAGYVLSVFDPASRQRTIHFLLKND